MQEMTGPLQQIHLGYTVYSKTVQPQLFHIALIQLNANFQTSRWMGHWMKSRARDFTITCEKIMHLDTLLGI